MFRISSGSSQLGGERREEEAALCRAQHTAPWLATTRRLNTIASTFRVSTPLIRVQLALPLHQRYIRTTLRNSTRDVSGTPDVVSSKFLVFFVYFGTPVDINLSICLLLYGLTGALLVGL